MIGIAIHIRVAKPRAHPLVMLIFPIRRQREIFILDRRIFLERSLGMQQAQEKQNAKRAGQRATQIHETKLSALRIAFHRRDAGRHSEVQSSTGASARHARHRSPPRRVAAPGHMRTPTRTGVPIGSPILGASRATHAKLPTARNDMPHLSASVFPQDLRALIVCQSVETRACPAHPSPQAQTKPRPSVNDSNSRLSWV